MELNDKLNELLGKIRPTDAQRKNLQDAHIRLRDRLMADEQLKPLIVDTFLQGSYRRHTAIRPDGDKSDVDIVVVTRLAREDFPNPERAMDILIPFLNEYYPGKWKKKGRAIGIELSKVKIDVVIASAPSQVEEDALCKFYGRNGMKVAIGGMETNGRPSRFGYLIGKLGIGKEPIQGSKSGGPRRRMA